MKVFFAGLMLLAGCATTHARQSQPPQLASFSILVTSTSTGWAARCESGCSWQGGSFKCADACDATVDANGLVTALTPRTEPTAFSFRLAHAANGVQAESHTGTAWNKLSWGCDTGPCTARIDQLGVYVSSVAR